jgi:RNA recognition motif-containing protein
LTDGRTGRPKGFGYVEFGARKDLEKALSFNQRELNGRNVRINVAEGSKRVDKFAGNWRQKPAEGAPRAFKEQFDNRNAFGGERQSSGYERPSGFGGRQSSFGSERQSGEKPASGWPKKDVAPKPAGVEAAKPPAPKPKSNPFGAAIESAQKRDQYAIEQEFEKRRLEREAERKAAAAAPVQKETKAWGAKKEFKKKEDAAPQTSWRRQGPVEKKTPTDKPTGEYTAFGATKRKAVKSTVSTTENTPAASAQGSRQNVYELLEVDLIN